MNEPTTCAECERLRGMVAALRGVLQYYNNIIPHAAAETAIADTAAVAKQHDAEVAARALEEFAKTVDAESRAVPVGDEFGSGGLAHASVFNVMQWAVTRARESAAKRQEAAK